MDGKIHVVDEPQATDSSTYESPDIWKATTIIFAIIVIGSVALNIIQFYLQQQLKTILASKQQPVIIRLNASITPTPSPTPAIDPEIKPGIKRHINQMYHYTFEYPSSWKINTEKNPNPAVYDSIRLDPVSINNATHAAIMIQLINKDNAIMISKVLTKTTPRRVAGLTGTQGSYEDGSDIIIIPYINNSLVFISTNSIYSSIFEQILSSVQFQ